MSALDDIARPDTELSGTTATTNQQKFLDLWWRISSHTGLTKLVAAIADGVLSRPVNKFDASWKPTAATTNGYTELGALPQNFANVHTDIAALRTEVGNLEANLAAAVANAVTAHFAANPVQAAPVDVNAVAEAVYARFRSQANK